MTEAEIYTVLCKFYHTKEPDKPERKLTFLVIAASENEDDMNIATAFIDPDIPEFIESLPVHLSTAQQTLIYFRDNIKEMMKGPIEAAMAIRQAYDIVGGKKMEELVAASSSAEEFGNRLIEALEIEKHGTGINE